MINVFYRRRKFIAAFLVTLFFTEVVRVPVAYALTSGPSQPEVQAFQPAGTTDMVDLFTGDFSYNIPLFELPGPNGGYPFNLSYQAGVGMDTESSWTGLGWSLNPGAINRQMRGLPDEFNGDKIYTKMDIDPSVTVGLKTGIGAEFFGGDLKIGFGLSVYQNNYKGLGYSLDGAAGYAKISNSGMTEGIGLGLNFSMDSEEGISASPSLSLNSKVGIFGLGVGYNSKEGLSSLTASYAQNNDVNSKNNVEKDNEEGQEQHSEPEDDGGEETEKKKKAMSGSATLSFSHPGYTPQVSMPMQNTSISATFKVGGAIWGAFGNGYVTGFYNEQRLKNARQRIPTRAYGYLNYQHGGGAKDLLDFNREKDGMVTQHSPNLPIPSLAYDIYSVMGQGISAMYRPMRNDIGVIHDPQTESGSWGGSGGVDVAPGASKVGINLSVNHSRSVSGPWTDNDFVSSATGFQLKEDNSLYEPWYFKVHGEPASEAASVLEAVGAEDPVRIPINDSYALGALETGRGWSSALPQQDLYNRDRKTRNQVIQPVTNEQLLTSNNEEVLPLFKVSYDSAGVERPYKRSSLPGNHTAGFTALTPDGLRYNYGIPAYNLSQEEVTHSAVKKPGDVSRVGVGSGGNGDPAYKHTGTDKFLKRVEMPPYAHAYLLTSIVGPDYVDMTGDGVTTDDLGYWVKFTYRKTTTSASPYQWRDPFSKAHYQKGWETDPRDDKGSFVYGTKELWYLVRAETKSHIATFTIEPREDGKGVAAKLQDTDNTGIVPVYALKEIRLFSRFSAGTYPIKTVKFEYDYSLCKGVYNNGSTAVSDTTGGKLTLKKLWFEYGHSERGRLNPYEFFYNELNNYDYDLYAYDRWGNYKPYPPADPLYNVDFPYAEQAPDQEETIDLHAAAWSIREIRLPSGGTVMVDYESDDYAYVQHRQAMQMVEIVAPAGDTGTESFSISDSNVKVRFPLKRPVAGSLSATEQRAEVLKYLDEDLGQIYFKLRINLRSAGEGFFEYVSGYADIDFDREDGMGLEKAGSDDYVYGFFHLEREQDRHPFSLRAWQHIRTNQPELASSGRKLKQTDNTGERIAQIKSLGSVITQIRQTFGGYNNFCSAKGWGREVVAGKSWIRLKAPDKIKYGGGLRTRQITMKDNWTHDDEGIYGQVYDYTTIEEGDTISSGVAAYEPIIGGDENALRYAKKYVESVPLRSDNNMYFEYPINESYYPGPRVGYSKVTVMSLPAASLAGKEVKHITLGDGSSLFPEGAGVSYGTSGITVQEFFTARDFPVITGETEKVNKPFRVAFSVPFLGSISVSNLATSQGYSIITNDMHGKPRKVSSYRQDPQGRPEEKPISWVQYNYAHDTVFYQKKRVLALDNTFIANGDGTLSLASSPELQNPSGAHYSIGQENEFFIDMREFDDKAWGGGAYYNTDFVYFFLGVIPIPTQWPDISNSRTQLRTAVTNKVIFKSGIQTSTEAYDGASRVVTKNLKWDRQTGVPVLTVVNNNFDDPVYSYSIPAYTQYRGMGAAYRNIGLTFDIENVDNLPYHDEFYQFTTAMADDVLFPGDEIILYAGSDLGDPVARVVFSGEESGDRLLYSEVPLTATAYKGMVIRSGYRNQLNVSAGSITALKDPSRPGAPVTYEETITVPKVN